jgi:hypothetical protein
MEGLGSITAAAIAFVGTHLLLSHPLRQPIVGAVGNGAFLGVYSAIAAATLAWLALAYRAPPTPLHRGLSARHSALYASGSRTRIASWPRAPVRPLIGHFGTLLGHDSTPVRRYRTRPATI